jgi:GMP synthase (glutamine-hydrolysing)
MNESPLLILVTGDPVPAVQRELGDFPTLIKNAVASAWKGQWHVVDARAALPDGVEWAGVIITGSAESITQPNSWMAPALDYVRSLVEASVPTFGICFGHQMLGAALGGRVKNNPKGREIGTVQLRVHELDPLVERALEQASVEAFQVNMTHMDSVVTLPPGARVLASTLLEPHALVRFAPNAWGVQFHPEIDRQVMLRYIEHRRAEIEAEGFNGVLLQAEAKDTPKSAGLMRTFVQGIASRA